MPKTKDGEKIRVKLNQEALKKLWGIYARAKMQQLQKEKTKKASGQ